MNTPRIRMFAGPNGSGKSTLKSVISEELLGVYINPDEIEKQIKQNGYLDLRSYLVKVQNETILDFFARHALTQRANLQPEIKMLRYSDEKLYFDNIKLNSYFASICADFIRKNLIEQKISFTFETVMSSKDKVQLLQLAQKNGYKTYLYYIATQDPIINVSRVKNRVVFGGHNVPQDKIISRYYKSLQLLREAIRYTNRAYIFDNSSTDRLWVAQINEAKEVELKIDTIPTWLQQYVLENKD
ncbi:MAG: zeta toxin family protein [Campylobacterota bacterium]